MQATDMNSQPSSGTPAGACSTVLQLKKGEKRQYQQLNSSTGSMSSQRQH
jgi:hypothetical protein